MLLMVEKDIRGGICHAICNEESDLRFFLEADVQYPENFHNLHNDLSFFPERMKIEKVEKLIANFHDKNAYDIDIKSKQTLNQGLVLKKVHRVIKFNQKAWVKPYIDMNTDLRKNQKLTLRKTF